jgi:tetratricopeptide (TPR) repeat protein
VESSKLPDTGLIEYEGGTLERVQGIYVAQLHGTYAAMGRQHAGLTNAACGDVVSQYLNGLIKKLIAHAIPPLATPADALLKALFHMRNRGNIGDEMRALIGGFSDGFDTSRTAGEQVLLVPDIVHYLAGRSFVPLAVPPMCTGLYATGAATRDGKQLFARNFDFFGRGIWNQCNALVVMHPNDGQRMCWIGALGSPCGPQGFNESGLVFSLHTNFTRDVRSKGIPLFTLCHKVLARCTTLDEAIRCIAAEPRLCGLSMFLLDTNARKAAVVGFSAHHQEVVYPEDDVLVRSNHYITAAMQRDEVAPYPWQRNSRGRFRRAHALLEAHRGTLAPEDLPAILSDCHDTWEDQTRVTGNILACINTTQSMAMSPDEDTLWLAHADHPVAHAARYAGFRMSAILQGDRAQYVCDPLKGASSLDTPQRAALQEYAEAWSAYFDNLNSDTAVFHLRRAAAFLPEEPIFPRMAGLLLLKQRRYAQALPFLIQNAAHPYKDRLMQAEAHLWVARCLDLLGRRAEARTAYEKAAALAVDPVSGAARRHLQKPFRTLDLLDVAPEFVCGTAIAKYRQHAPA